MRFPTMWYVQPAKAQTIREPLLAIWLFYVQDFANGAQADLIDWFGE